MDLLAALIESYRKHRDQQQRALDDLKAGKFRIGENRGQGGVDTTPRQIDIISASIAEFDRIIAEYDASQIVR